MSEIELEIFEKVFEHLLKQNKKSTDKGGDCQYRLRDDEQTLKCAVGCLIEDQFYDPRIEGITMCALVIDAEKWCASMGGAGELAGRTQMLADALNLSKTPATQRIHRMLNLMQTIHDSFEPYEWKKKLEGLKADMENPNW